MASQAMSLSAEPLQVTLLRATFAPAPRLKSPRYSHEFTPSCWFRTSSCGDWPLAVRIWYIASGAWAPTLGIATQTLVQPCTVVGGVQVPVTASSALDGTM